MDPADNTMLHPAALVAAQVLRRMGATVDLQAMDWSTLMQRRASKEPPAQGGWNVFVTNATADRRRQSAAQQLRQELRAGLVRLAVRPEDRRA